MTGEPVPGAWWDWLLCLVALRCANANGIAQTASSASRISALQRKCALMEGLRCFFIVFALVIFEVQGSSTGEIGGTGLGGCTCGGHAFRKKRGSMSTHFSQFLYRGLHGFLGERSPGRCAKLPREWSIHLGWGCESNEAGPIEAAVPAARS